MIRADYTEGKNIAHTWIRWPCVRVSTASFPYKYGDSPFGMGYETWIFSDCPKQATTQKHHRSERESLKVHGHIVSNLKNKFLKINETAN